MPKLTKRTDGRTDPNYRKATLLTRTIRERERAGTMGCLLH